MKPLAQSTTPSAELLEAERENETLALEGRIPELTGSLRQHAARGTLINAAFQVGLAGLSLVQRILVAAFLTPRELGIWGVILITVLTLLFLKNSGISDKFVQQTEPNQEVAFQKAFTFELFVSFGFIAFTAALLPIFALAYGTPAIIAPGLVLLLAVLGNSLQAPTWIFYRQMDFVRQRTIQAVDPGVTFAVTIGLAIAGIGYWCLIIGAIAGSFTGAAVALRACPYRLKLRFDRGTARDYFSFSWPLFVAGVGAAVIAQGSVLAGSHAVGLAGVGAIGLAVSISAFSEGVDSIVTQTLYPAICAVRDRADLLYETFVKSNRIALMWGMPFGLGLALFASDLVHFVIGERWRSAVILLQVFGVVAAADQLGFNWMAFFRARNETRPIAVVAGVTVTAFATITVPLLFIYGLPGYAVGMAAMTAVMLIARTYFLARLFSGFQMLWHAGRAIAPSVPAVLLILGLRLLEPGDRTLELAIGELVAYFAVTVGATIVFERDLLREILGYLRRPGGPAATKVEGSPVAAVSPQ